MKALTVMMGVTLALASWSYNTTIHDLEKRNAALTAKVDLLDSKVDGNESLLNDLGDKVDEIESQTDQLNEDLGELQ